ncbi:RNA 2',3'-cyclic phosphodiesterase [Massilia forsythiae]|uniref:RNA 2',3'-cyclic phosphodiesterase n=1 Tax=Massilia forsythiae TaxID=2728020 RepID=A0A7Z2VWH4_9BURK|nr:RNA 2',3'-cyclic phosphodiesterase [Massilia forsythiae]QJE00419.1 RNA 2',3'-cyclic phosphodiesterase [Massilia forsythiae]
MATGNGQGASGAAAPCTRLFLALWPDTAVRARLRARRDAWDWPRNAAPVHADKLHLTLHFLGAVPDQRVALLLDRLAVPFTPFTVRIGRPVLWHNGIAVLEPYETPPALLDLHARLAQALPELGLAPEARAYRPHVTMARRAGGVVVPPEDDPVEWLADHYALVESRPGHGGGYTVLREYR